MTALHPLRSILCVIVVEFLSMTSKHFVGFCYKAIGLRNAGSQRLLAFLHLTHVFSATGRPRLFVRHIF